MSYFRASNCNVTVGLFFPLFSVNSISYTSGSFGMRKIVCGGVGVGPPPPQYCTSPVRQEQMLSFKAGGGVLWGFTCVVY